MQQVTLKIKWLGFGSLAWLIFFAPFTVEVDFLHMGVEGGDYAQFFLIFPFILLLLSIVLYFSRREVFDPWFKFARIYLLVAFIPIILAPATGTYWGLRLGLNKESATWTTAFLFAIISLMIIVRAHRRLKRQAVKGITN